MGARVRGVVLVTGRVRALAVELTAGFIVYLDTTVLLVAFGAISASFPEASSSARSWVLDAYFIVFAALMVPGGRWADQFGSRNVFAIGVSTFILSSVGCAVAPTLGALVAARAAQAVGAALMGPASLALILPYFGRGSRATAVSLWGTSAALAAALGPPLGGFLADTVGWRGIFLINVPIGLAVLAGLRNVDNRGDAVAGQLVNTSAIVLIASGVGALTAGILEGPSWGWGQRRTLLLLIAGAILLAAAMVGVARHHRRAEPIHDFDKGRFFAANAATAIFGAGFYGLLLAVVFFLTSHWHYSTFEAGLAMMPIFVAAALAAIPAGRIADARGHRWAVIPGCWVFALDVFLFWLLTTSRADYASRWLPGSILCGIGIGCVMPVLASAAIDAMPGQLLGTANALNSMLRQFGAALGTAAVGTLLVERSGHSPIDVGSFRVVWAFLGTLAIATIPFALRLIRPAWQRPVEEPQPAAAECASPP
ncbi:MFS transporter [Mycobacterium ulcerans]|uniref:MFS transporter n=1 Tax=Mycobacterium ulcerans TaxID=1809 RepID=UPI00106C889C|nr:MFS transporter [Mycobacterium ulcerans]